ncbi:putative 5'-AMP-activated protein kinase subunit beta-1 family protein, partial [Toxoplasma gondii ARI]
MDTRRTQRLSHRIFQWLERGAQNSFKQKRPRVLVHPEPSARRPPLQVHR